MARKILKETPNNLSFPADYRLDKQGMSQSLLSQFLKCRRAFLFSVNQWSHPSKMSTTNFGSMFHEVVAAIYKGGVVPSDDTINELINSYVENSKKDGQLLIDNDKIERDCAACFAVLKTYVQHYKTDITTCKFDNIETEFNVEIDGIVWRGKIDARYLTKLGARWQMEHKTKSRISEDALQKRLTFDPQNLLYLIAGEKMFNDKVDGVLYNIVRNPQLKIKVSESIKDFQDRMIDDVAKRPEFYFMQFEVPYTLRDRKAFMKDLSIIQEDIKRCVNNNEVYKNGFSCEGMYNCEFLDVCSSNSFAGYLKKDKLFSELDSVEF